MLNQINELLLIRAKKEGLELNDDTKQRLFEKAKEIYSQVEKEFSLEDYEYLLHHITVDDDGNEEIHHCFLYDHIGNLYQQGHLTIKKNKIYIDNKEVKEGNFHIIVGLEPTQEVAWSDEMAEEHNIKPKEMESGMSLKDKSKVW